jgi:hypothetical protein
MERHNGLTFHKLTGIIVPLRRPLCPNSLLSIYEPIRSATCPNPPARTAVPIEQQSVTCTTGEASVTASPSSIYCASALLLSTQERQNRRGGYLSIHVSNRHRCLCNPLRTRAITRTPITFSKGCGTQTTGQCFPSCDFPCESRVAVSTWCWRDSVSDVPESGPAVCASPGDAVALCLFSGSHDCLHLGSRYSVASLAIRLCFISSRVIFASGVSNATFL